MSFQYSKNGKKESPENYRPVSVTCIPRKGMGQLFLDVIYTGRKRRSSGVVNGFTNGYGFTKGKHARPI